MNLIPSIFRKIARMLDVDSSGQADQTGLIFRSSSSKYEAFSITSFAETFLDDADAAAVRTTIGAASTSAVNAISSGYSRRASVIDKVDCTAAPPTEVTGDRYIIDNTAGSVHADWDGSAKNDLVEFNGSTWDATTPAEGWTAHNDTADLDELFIDDGSPAWQQRAAGSGVSTLNGETGSTQTFADVDDTNVTLTIGSSSNVHTFTIGWAGTLSHERGGLEEDVSAFAGVPLIDSGTTSEIKYNLTATTNPGVNDDSSAGYTIGSRWVNVALDKEFVCLDATVGAAVWSETSHVCCSGSGSEAYKTLTDATTITINQHRGDDFKVTLGGNRTIALTNPTEAQSVLIFITQDGTGGRTLTWPSSIKWPGGTAPTLTTGANKSDWIGIKCVNSSTPVYHGFVVGQDYAA